MASVFDVAKYVLNKEGSHQGLFNVGIKNLEKGNPNNLTDDQKETIDIVLRDYGNMAPYELREMTQYKGASILRCVSIFGGNENNYLHKDVLIYMNLSGKIFINPNAPECVKSMFRAVGVKI